MLLAASSVVLGPTAFLVCLGFLLCGAFGVVTGAGGALAVMRLRPKPPKTAAKLSAQAKKAAYAANREDLGFLTDFFDAVASNDMVALADASQKLTYKLDEGTLADLLEDFVKRRVRVLMANETDRRELLDLVGELVGADLHSMLAAKKAPLTRAVPLVTSVVAFLALCLGASSFAIAGTPEKFQPTEKRVVIDPPTFPKASTPKASPVVTYHWRPYRRWFRRR